MFYIVMHNNNFSIILKHHFSNIAETCDTHNSLLQSVNGVVRQTNAACCLPVRHWDTNKRHRDVRVASMSANRIKCIAFIKVSESRVDHNIAGL